MRRRSEQIGIGLLKAAGAAEVGAAHSEKLINALKSIYQGGKNVAGYGAGAGATVAQAAGLHPVVGKVVGGGLALGGTGVAGVEGTRYVHRKAKQKLDEAKFRLQYGDPSQYGY